MRLITLEEHTATEPFLQATAPPNPPQGPMAALIAHLQSLLLDLDTTRLAAMDRAGVDLQVLSVGPGLNNLEPGLATELAAEANRTMAAAIAAHPTRFAAFAALAPQRPDTAAQALDHAVRNLNFKGALLSGTVGGRFLDHPDFLPIFETAAALDVPIYLHPAPPPPAVRDAYFADLPNPLGYLLSTSAWGWHVETGLHALRLITSGLFDRLPNLKLIIGHMGENLPFSITRADTVLTRANLPLQRSVRDYFQGNFWITTSGYFSAPPFLCAREVLGIDRILFSVDYPYSQPEDAKELLDQLRPLLAPAELEKVASANAAALLRL